MTRYAVPSLVGAVVSAVLGIVAIMLGNGLVPSRAESIERAAGAPWVIVWLMVIITAGCAFVLAVFLFRKGTEGLKRGRA
jgi:hypothetical protein